MGNVPDRSKGSTIFIQLDKTEFQKGSILKGTVHLELKAAYMSKAINLQFQGYERRSKKKHDIVNQNIELSKFEEGYVQTGCYSFPFEINLPEELPSSLIYHNMKIKYQLTASMKPLKKQKLTPLIFKQPIIIYQGTQDPSYELIKDHKTSWRNIFLQQTHSQAIQSKFNKSLYFIGDTIHGTIKFLDYKHLPKVMKIVLYANIQKFKKDESKKLEKKLVIETVEFNDLQQRLNDVNFEIPIIQEKLIEISQKSKNSQETKMTLFIQTMKSQKLVVEFFVKIQIKYKNCLQKKVFEHPIIIQAIDSNLLEKQANQHYEEVKENYFVMNNQIGQPINWQPQMFPVQQIELGMVVENESSNSKKSGNNDSTMESYQVTMGEPIQQNKQNDQQLYPSLPETPDV